jgi:hypothetical protein
VEAPGCGVRKIIVRWREEGEGREENDEEARREEMESMKEERR